MAPRRFTLATATGAHGVVERGEGRGKVVVGVAG